jgi:tyrosine-protein kinase Etk/Wzc
MKTEHEPISRRIPSSQPLIRDYPAVLLRGKWTIITVIAVVLVAALVFTKLRSPVYQASTAILIQTQSSESRGLFIPTIGSAIITNVRQNELEILRSQSLAETVARRLISQMFIDSIGGERIEIIKTADDEKPARTVATVEQIVKRLGQAVDFVTVRESDVIKIIAKSKNPREAALLANVFTSEYYNRNVYKSRQKSRALREFLQAQVGDQRTNLERLEGALQAYMENKGIVLLDEESRKMIEQLSELEATRDATEISLQSLERTVASYQAEVPQQEQMLARSIGTSNDPYIKNLQEQIATLEVQRDLAVSNNPALAGREVFGDKLKEVEAQIRELQEKLRVRTKEYIETLLPSSTAPDQASLNPSAYLRQVKQKMLEGQIEIQTLRAKREALNSVIAEYEKQFARIPGKSIQYARLERGKLSSEKLFVLLNDKLNEATIAEQSQFGYIDIIDQATVPIEPSSPNLMLNVVIGLVVGLFLGVLMVIAREFRDVRIHTPEDLKLKGFAPAAVVMGMDPEIKRLADKPVLSRYGRPMDPHLLTLADSFSPVAEAYKKLRTAIQFEPSFERRPQTILVSSPNRGEGKSTTAANLAISFAQNGKMVLLLDANLRRPSIHGMLDLFRQPGLSDLLQDKVGYDGVVQITKLRNLHVLCSGTPSSNPAELIASDKMRDLVQQAELEYDVIVLDSPPVLTVADASIVSTFVDIVLLVVSAGTTRMEELERSVEVIENVGGKMPKYLLNRFDQQRAYGISYARSGYGYYGYRNGKARERALESEERT